jgi:hypothetical protein
MYFRPIALHPSGKYYCNDIDFHPAVGAGNED